LAIAGKTPAALQHIGASRRYPNLHRECIKIERVKLIANNQRGGFILMRARD
jgi:hypothetical protein